MRSYKYLSNTQGGRHQTKSFCTAKESSLKKKATREMGENTFKPSLHPGLISRMCEQLIGLSCRNPNSPAEKWAGALKRDFPKKTSMQTASGHMRRCPAPLITREMRGPAGTPPPTSPIGAVRKARAVNVERRGQDKHCCWERDLVQPPWETVWRCRRRLRVELLMGPALLLLSCLEEGPVPRVHGSVIPGGQAWKPPECPLAGDAGRKHTHWRIAQPKRRRTSCHLWPDGQAWRPLSHMT